MPFSKRNTFGRHTRNERATTVYIVINKRAQEKSHFIIIYLDNLLLSHLTILF